MTNLTLDQLEAICRKVCPVIEGCDPDELVTYAVPKMTRSGAMVVHHDYGQPAWQKVVDPVRAVLAAYREVVDTPPAP